MERITPLWKEHRNGYAYAKWDRLVEEPETAALLKQEAGARVETDEFIYYVNFHDTYGWSVGRKRKSNQKQELQDISLQQQPPRYSSPSIQAELQELRQAYTTMANTLEKKLAEMSETLHHLGCKNDQSHHVSNNDQVDGNAN